MKDWYDFDKNISVLIIRFKNTINQLFNNNYFKKNF